MAELFLNRYNEPDGSNVNLYTKISAAFLFFAIIYLGVQASLSGIAYLNQYHVNATLDQWYGNKKAVSQVQWEELESFAISAISSNETDATMLNAVGRLYDYRSSKMAKDKSERLFYSKKSIEYYRQVIQYRPAWPYGWMNLALSKARIGTLDDEYKHALIQLLKTGAWEKLTLPTIIRLSLFSWYNLDKHSHQLLLDYFLVAQDERERDVLKLLKSSGQLEFYCRKVMQRDAKARFCQ